MFKSTINSIKNFFLKNSNKLIKSLDIFKKLELNDTTKFIIFLLTCSLVFYFSKNTIYVKLNFVYFIVIFFMLFLYIRSSMPRYKIIDFTNKYWKYIVVYTVIIIIYIIL